jgi:hypothetical protein
MKIMLMSDVTTLAAGVLATIGLGSVLLASAIKEEALRQRLFNLGASGLTICGAVLMVGSLFGWQNADAIFLGLLLVVFGSDAKLLPGNSCRQTASQTPAP